jgi:hypothetical protein
MKHAHASAGNDKDDDAGGSGRAEAAEAGGMAKKKGSYHMPLVTYARTPYVVTAPREALAMLLRSGVAVVLNMLLRERAAATHSGLMDALEGVFPVFKRDDATTWRQLCANGAKHAMLLQPGWAGAQGRRGRWAQKSCAPGGGAGRSKKVRGALLQNHLLLSMVT